MKDRFKFRYNLNNKIYDNTYNEHLASPYWAIQKQLKRKEQESKNLKEELRGCRIGIKNISIENTEICKISEKYKRALDDIEKYQKRNCEVCVFANAHKCNISCQIFAILNIINKAKDGE